MPLSSLTQKDKVDIQYKGSGKTPYSRGADGRAGIETCTVVGYEDGSAVSGITTHVITGSGTTMKNTYGSGNYDVQTFYISYNGSSNTTNTSYKIYGSSNSDYKFPRAYQ